jgi:hypothetical protein
MRPNGGGRSPGFFTISGKHDMHVIHITVSVGIIILQVDFPHGMFHGFEKQNIRVHVRTAITVRAIISHRIHGPVRP